jgi:hypothetical protein
MSRVPAWWQNPHRMCACISSGDSFTPFSCCCDSVSCLRAVDILRFLRKGGIFLPYPGIEKKWFSVYKMTFL